MSKLVVLLFVLPFVTPMMVELWLLHARPELFARFALWTAGTHTFKLRRPKRSEDDRSYREVGNIVPIPTLELSKHFGGGRDFVGGRLIGRRGRLMLHSPLWPMRGKVVWLFSIEVRQYEDTITLTARRVFVPMSIVLTGLLVCVAFSTTQNWIACIVVLLIGTLLTTGMMVTEHDAHTHTMREAFRYLEREYRALLEVPK